MKGLDFRAVNYYLWHEPEMLLLCLSNERFQYTLLTDGNEVGTKRLILTN